MAEFDEEQPTPVDMMEPDAQQQFLERLTRLLTQDAYEPGPAFWRITAVVTQGRLPSEETTPELAADRSQLDALAARWVSGEFSDRQAGIELDNQFVDFYPEFQKLLRPQTLSDDEQVRFDHLNDLVVTHGSISNVLLAHAEQTPVTPEQIAETTVELQRRLGVDFGKDGPTESPGDSPRR